MTVACPHCGTPCIATQEDRPAQQIRRLHCPSCGYRAVTTTTQRRDGAGSTQTLTHTERSPSGSRAFAESHSSASGNAFRKP